MPRIWSSAQIIAAPVTTAETAIGQIRPDCSALRMKVPQSLIVVATQPSVNGTPCVLDEHGQQVGRVDDGQEHVSDTPAPRNGKEEGPKAEEREQIALVDASGNHEEGDGHDAQGDQERQRVVAVSGPERGAHQDDYEQRIAEEGRGMGEGLDSEKRASRRRPRPPRRPRRCAAPRPNRAPPTTGPGRTCAGRGSAPRGSKPRVRRPSARRRPVRCPSAARSGAILARGSPGQEGGDGQEHHEAGEQQYPAAGEVPDQVAGPARAGLGVRSRPRRGPRLCPRPCASPLAVRIRAHGL